MKEKFLYIVLILCCFIGVSCGNHENVNPYEIKIINKSDTIKSRTMVIYNGKTTMPVHRIYHCYYLTLQYKDLSASDANWSNTVVMDVDSKTYRKYDVGNTYKINGHTHISSKDNTEYICWRSL